MRKKGARQKYLTALRKQIIVSTQSVDLVSEFDPEGLVVVDRKEEKSIFSRLKPDELQDWLQEYNLGELWKKNIFDGRPQRLPGEYYGIVPVTRNHIMVF